MPNKSTTKYTVTQVVHKGHQEAKQKRKGNKNKSPFMKILTNI